MSGVMPCTLCASFRYSLLTSSPRPQAHPPLLAPRLVLHVLQVWIHLLSEWRQGAVFLVVATGCLCTRGVWVGGTSLFYSLSSIYFKNNLLAVAACTSCLASGWLLVVAARDSLFYSTRGLISALIQVSIARPFVGTVFYISLA